MQKFFSILSILCCFGLLSQNRYAAANIPQTLIQNVNSVVQEERIQIDISENNKLVHTKFQAITVLNESGNSHVDAQISYDDDMRIKDVEAYIYGADGRELKHFKKKDFLDASAYDGISIFSDNRILYLNYTPTEYPYTFVIEATTQSGSTAFIPRWFPLDSYKKSVMSSELVVTYNPNNKPRVRMSNLDGFDIQFFEGPNTITCKASNLPAITYEGYSPSFVKIAPHLAFALDQFYLKGVPGRATNWNEFGRWMNTNLLSDTRELSEATINKIKQLVAEEKTDIDKARKVYQYLQDKVRYISVQVGIGGWKPMLAKDVDNLGYGDCKALTNYTKALLDALEIPSYYTILYAGNDENDIISDFTSMQGNHVLLGLPTEEEIIWLECTSQDDPFGYNGNFSDDRDVLIITDQGGEIVHTKAYSFQENLQSTTVDAFIDADGKLTAKIQSQTQGLQYDRRYQLELLDSEDLHSAYKERWAHLNGVLFDEIDFENNKKEILFTEKVTASVSNYATLAGEDLLLPVNVIHRDVEVPARSVNRKHDLYIPEGYTKVDKVVFTMSKALKLGAIPEDVTVASKFGSYQMKISKINENTFEYYREKKKKKGQFDAEEYQNYRKFLRMVSKKDKTKILLKKY